MLTVNFMNWNCYLKFGQYANGRTAIQLFDTADHEPVCTATVNVPEVELPEGYVFIKNYSENEGILETLVAAGIIDPPTIMKGIGQVMVHGCKLNVDPEDA